MSGGTPSSLRFTLVPLSRIHKFLTLPNIAAALVFDNTLTKFTLKTTYPGVGYGSCHLCLHDGQKHEAPIEEGQSLMQVATNNAVPGIDGDCGRRSRVRYLSCDRRSAMVRAGRPRVPRRRRCSR